VFRKAVLAFLVLCMAGSAIEAQQFIGLTDGQGDFAMTLNIPSVRQLAGITIWSAAVTATVHGIIDITPDVEITFTT
jgi:hypothetical protein